MSSTQATLEPMLKEMEELFLDTIYHKYQEGTDTVDRRKRIIRCRMSKRN